MLRGAFKEQAPVKGRGWPSSLPPPCVTWILDSGELYALSHPTAPTIDNLKKKTEIIRLSLLGCSMWKPNWGALSWGPAREDLRALAGAQPPQIMTLNCTQLSVFQHCLNNLTCGSITSSQPDWFALCPEAGDAISQTGLKSWEHQSHSGRHYYHCLRALLCARGAPSQIQRLWSLPSKPGVMSSLVTGLGAVKTGLQVQHLGLGIASPGGASHPPLTHPCLGGLEDPSLSNGCRSGWITTVLN